MEGHIYFFFIMNALFYNELLAIHDTNAFLQALLLHTLQIIYLACHLAYLCHFFDTSIHTTQSKALGSTCLSCYCKISLVGTIGESCTILSTPIETYAFVFINTLLIIT